MGLEFIIPDEIFEKLSKIKKAKKLPVTEQILSAIDYHISATQKELYYLKYYK